MRHAKASSKKRAQGRKRPTSKAPPEAGPFLTGKKLNAVLSVLLAGVTTVLYSPVTGHRFLVLDDRDYVVANSHIHGGLSWDTIKWAFTSTEAANWHPLTWLSHALDYQLFALSPAGHHFDNVAIHALNAVVLFLVLVWVTKRTAPSFLVAALFALHPINVESVAWVAERKNVLSTLFFLLTIGAYAWYARKPDWRRYLVVAALFAAGLMAKPMVITLPFVLLLLDYWPLARMLPDETQSGLGTAKGPPLLPFSSLLLEKIPLLLLSAASAWLTLKAQRPAVRTFAEIPLGLRIENALAAYGLYLWKTVWPARLALYPYSATALPAWQWILSVLVLIGVTAFVVGFRKKRYLPVGWFWFLGTLVPVIGLVQVGEYAMADRYAYVPLIGIFVVIAWSLADWAEAKKVGALWRAIPALLALTALVFVTSRQITYWDSDYHLWSHTLESGESAMAHNALGIALMGPESRMTRQELEDLGSEQNRIAEARLHFERALELGSEQSPHDMARTLGNLANIDRLQNRMDLARQHSERALAIYRQLAQQSPDEYLPYLAATLYNLGSEDRSQNRLDEARQHYEEALEINRQLAAQDPAKYLPNIAMMLNEFGFLDASQSRMDEARQHYEEALTIDRQLAEHSPAVYLPDLAITLTDFGVLDASQQRLDEARQHYGEALMIDRQLAQQNPPAYLPDLAMALNNMAFVDSKQNRLEDSRAHYQEALRLYLKLLQGDNEYAGAVARIEGSLQKLSEKDPSP